jgi:hypothetical protein
VNQPQKVILLGGVSIIHQNLQLRSSAVVDVAVCGKRKMSNEPRERRKVGELTI